MPRQRRRTYLRLVARQAAWETTSGSVHEKAILPGDGQQPELDKAGEQIVEGVTVEVVANRLAYVSPCHSCLPGLGYERHDQIGCRHMTVVLTISVMQPGVEIVDVHYPYVFVRRSFLLSLQPTG